MSQEGYVTGITVAHFVEGARRLGVDADRVLADCGVDPARDFRPDRQFPGGEYEELLAALVLASGDTLFGLHVGEQLMPGAYGMLGHMALGSPSVRESVQLLTQFQGLAGDMGRVELEPVAEGGMIFHWHMVHGNPVLRRHVTDNVMALTVRFVRLATGRPDARPVRLEVEYDFSSDAERAELEAAMGCAVMASRGRNLIELPAEVLDLPINRFDSGFVEMLAERAREQLAVFQQKEDVLASARRHLRELLYESYPRRQQVADRLGVSERTLDRRLADAGVSWQVLLDSTRQQLAREYLADRSLRIAEISRRLGFSDTRSFQRRFKKWTGMTPSSFRNRLA